MHLDLLEARFAHHLNRQTAQEAELRLRIALDPRSAERWPWATGSTAAVPPAAKGARRLPRDRCQADSLIYSLQSII